MTVNEYLECLEPEELQKVQQKQVNELLCLERHYNKGTEEETVNYHCDVLEAKIVLGENLIVSIASEFIENNGEDAKKQKNMSEEERKQDCETKAFKRLSRKVKKAFPRLPIILPETGRKRWKIENEGFNRQKNWQGDITHACSWNPNAMKNHYLMIQTADMIKQLYEWFFLKKNEIKKKQKNISSDLLASFGWQLTREDISSNQEERITFN